MTHYKAASFLILAWGIFMLVSAALAFYFMGTAAMPLLVVAGLAGTLGFSSGHFMNRGRKQTFIMALASALVLVFLLSGLTSRSFSESLMRLDTLTDAWSAQPRDVSLLVSSAMLTATVCLLICLVIFAKSIYRSFPQNTSQH